MYQNWKQPDAYHFSRASTKANMLVSFLNEDLGACQNAGLHVGATICDMSANSVKVLKILGATKWKAFFTYQNQDIVAVYDCPHCQKCTRNLFLKYDVQFESELMHNQLPATVMWKHFLNIYI